MQCKCLRETCGHEWVTKGDKEPQSCPGCKSYVWNKKKKSPVVAKGIERAIETKCTKCGRDFIESETVYSVRELKLKKGYLVFTDKLQQGLFCEECMPSEKALPFVGGGNKEV
jgi:hypothetical protein